MAGRLVGRVGRLIGRIPPALKRTAPILTRKPKVNVKGLKLLKIGGRWGTIKKYR